MSKEALEKFLAYRKIQLYTIKYLEKNKDKIIERAISHIQKNTHEIYVLELKDTILEKFEYSINQHFQWMIDKCEDGTVSFENYKTHINQSVRNAYCDFYTYILEEEISKVEHIQIKENITDYINALINKYCN